MSGTDPFLPATTLLAMAIMLALVRSRTVTARLAAEVAAMAAIMVVLGDRGTSPLPVWQSLAARSDGPWLRALAIVWWLVGARLVATVMTLALGRDARSRQARLFSDLVAGAIYLSAAYVIADTILDLPVRGLIATSGVIAVVLGLALQNTLGDLFSGIAVGVEQPFGVGDTLSFGADSGGVVTEMNWRSVRLQSGAGDIVTIPNSVIAKASVTNHSRPSERRSASVEVPVRSRASAGRLIDLLRQSLALCPDVLVTPEPTIAIESLDRSGACFSIAYHVADSGKLAAARGQVLRQARRFLRHGGVLAGQPFDTPARLRETLLFENLGDDALAAVANGLVRGHLEPGELLMERGGRADALTIVASGVLQVDAGEPDAPHCIGRIGPGEYFGEIGMTTGEASPVTVRALTAVETLRLPKDALLAIVASDPGLAKALERSVRRGVAMLERDAAARAIHPITDKQGFLRHLATFLRSSERNDQTRTG